MMSLAEINRLSDEAAKEAAEKGLVPYVPFNRKELDNYPTFPFPNIGSHKPEGWIELEDKRMFVDKTGMGDENEPALTIQQLLNRLYSLYDEDSSLGFAITEEGPFQAYISVFKKVD